MFMTGLLNIYANCHSKTLPLIFYQPTDWDLNFTDPNNKSNVKNVVIHRHYIHTSTIDPSTICIFRAYRLLLYLLTIDCDDYIWYHYSDMSVVWSSNFVFIMTLLFVCLREIHSTKGKGMCLKDMWSLLSNHIVYIWLDAAEIFWNIPNVLGRFW